MPATTVATWLNLAIMMMRDTHVGNLLAHGGLMQLSCMGLMWTNWCCRKGVYEGGKQSGTTVVFVRAFHRI